MLADPRLQKRTEKIIEMLHKHLENRFTVQYSKRMKNTLASIETNGFGISFLFTFNERYVKEAKWVEIENTVLHEIAHALVGPIKGHNAEWKKKALEIGCDGRRLGKVEWSPK